MKREFRSVLLLKVPHCVHPSVAPDTENFRSRHTFGPQPSFALAALCGFLRKHNAFGYEVRALDINLEGYQEVGKPIDITEYPKLMFEHLRRASYDVLAVSVMFAFNGRWLEEAVKISRQYNPEAKIIVGGGYATVFPRRCLEEHDVDSVVIGEGEATLLHLLNRYNGFRDSAFEARFPFDGFGERNSEGDIRIVPLKSYLDMGEVPPPAWDALNLERYFSRSGSRAIPIEVVRGCPYRCTFCNTHLTWGYKLRYKSVSDAIAEMVNLKERFGAEPHFIDDNRSADLNWMKSFLGRVKQEGLSLEASPSSFHAKHLDPELLTLLKAVGVKTIGIGVETGSPEMQRFIRKHLDLERLESLVGLIKSMNLRVHLNFIAGFPGETIEQVQETIAYARKLKAHSYQFLILVPYPGTEVFGYAEENDLLRFDSSDLDRFEPRGSNFLRSSEWTYDQLEEMIYDANIELNFLRNPSLESPDHVDFFLDYLERLRVRLPGHLVASMVIGYIYRSKGLHDRAEENYRLALRDLQHSSVKAAFSRYLRLETRVVEDFLRFSESLGLSL